jgi:hypothetical protein
VVAPGGTVALGVWGGPEIDYYYDDDGADGPRRLFVHRSEHRWRSLLDIVGPIDDFQVWPGPAGAPTAFHYHLTFLTTPAT